MLKIISPLVLASLLWCMSSASEKDLNQRPNTLILRSDALLKVKQSLNTSTRYTASLKQLRLEADVILKHKPSSVMDKNLVPASGSKHDYYSLATYWWPDPSKPSGLPYIRHDGERNPEIYKGTDYAAFLNLCSSVETLSLAYWFTRDEKYASKTSELLHVWFINPSTRMNPNLQYAQAIRGINDGRGIGIIETHYLIPLIDGLALIEGSRTWSAADKTAMHDWLNSFYLWLTTSQNGLEEKAAKNNHGSWWDVQAVDLALALGRNNEAIKLLEEAKLKRIAYQIEPDGSQPLELERTNSLNYSIFNLEALVALSRLAENVNLDLWNFTTRDGRNISKALAFIAPYLDPEKKWPKKDIVEAKRNRIPPLLIEALHHEDNQIWHELLMKYSDKPDVTEHWKLTWVN